MRRSPPLLAGTLHLSTAETQRFRIPHSPTPLPRPLLKALPREGSQPLGSVTETAPVSSAEALSAPVRAGCGAPLRAAAPARSGCPGREGPESLTAPERAETEPTGAAFAASPVSPFLLPFFLTPGSWLCPAETQTEQTHGSSCAAGAPCLCVPRLPASHKEPGGDRLPAEFRLCQWDPCTLRSPPQ